MPADPYTPPKAAVSDLELDRDTRAKPKEVKIALSLIWASIGIGLINSVFDPTLRSVFATTPLFAWITLLLTVGITVLLIVFLGRGKNWARIVFLVFFILGAILMLFELQNTFQTWWPTAVVNVAQAAMQALALYLVFTVPGSHWYRRRR
jgi:hypothetical protein